MHLGGDPFSSPAPTEELQGRTGGGALAGNVEIDEDTLRTAIFVSSVKTVQMGGCGVLDRFP